METYHVSSVMFSLDGGGRDELLGDNVDPALGTPKSMIMFSCVAQVVHHLKDEWSMRTVCTNGHMGQALQ